MKRFAFAVIVFLGLNTSCAPTITPQAQIALASATVQIPTATPTLTSTPTITRSPTSTSTPTITPTPTQTQAPKFLWASNFENGFAGANGFEGWSELPRSQGGAGQVVPDPTSSGKGFVQWANAGDNGQPPVEEYSDGWLVYRLYPAKWFFFHPAPCEVKEDVWMSKELSETLFLGRNFIEVGPDVFDKWPRDGGEWSTAAQAMLFPRFISRGKLYLTLLTYGTSNSKIYGQVESNAPEFTLEQWHTVSIFIEQNREMRLYQDGTLVSRNTLPKEKRAGTVGGHPGLYAYQYKSEPPFKGLLLVDNYEIRCW